MHSGAWLSHRQLELGPEGRSITASVCWGSLHPSSSFKCPRPWGGDGGGDRIPPQHSTDTPGVRD